MNTPTNLFAIGVASLLCLGWSVVASANAELGSVQEEAIAPAPSATPPAMRPGEPGRTQGARDPAATRRPGEAPAVRLDPSHFIQNARQLIRQEVVSGRGDHLGTVEDLVIDLNTGQVAFVAVGPGPQLRPVPPQAFAPRPDERILILDMDMDRWEAAPAIERADLMRLARDREARRIYRHYGEDFSSAARDRREARDQVFGAPSRWQQRHATEPGRLPGDPEFPRAQPPVLPPHRTEAHQDLRWEREFGTPHERGVVRDHRAEEPGREAREQAGPTLRNPRFHSSHRGTHRLPHGVEPMPREFGEPPVTRRDHAAPESAVPHAERLQWASRLIGQPAATHAGDPVGEVADFIIDLDRGRVQHVVLAYEHPERQMYALPLNEIEMDRFGRVFVHSDQEALREAPRYEPREARRQPNRAFRYDNQATQREFGVPERRQDGAKPRL